MLRDAESTSESLLHLLKIIPKDSKVDIRTRNTLTLSLDEKNEPAGTESKEVKIDEYLHKFIEQTRSIDTDVTIPPYGHDLSQLFEEIKAVPVINRKGILLKSIQKDHFDDIGNTIPRFFEIRQCVSNSHCNPL
jgi:hypothetical protein